MIRVYQYNKCSSCRKAVKWLEEKGVAFEDIAIKDQQPSREELAEMLKIQDGNIRKLFNTSGMDYRSMGLKDKLAGMSEDEAFDLLQSNGMLVKRPFVIGDGVGLLGFKEELWADALLK